MTSSGQDMSDIEVQNITKKFGDFTAVDNVSFSVEHSEIFGLLGPNGAGKSTLIRMLTTLIPTTSGSARICGHDVVTEADAVRHVIGVIPQAMTSDLELSVEENLLIYAKLYGVPREKRRRLMSELIEAVELTKWKDKPVKNLSGGMRRRVEIARGLVHEPRVFFLDEPTTGLDPVSRVAVWEMLKQLKQQRDLTVLLTTHYMDEADKLCDRIAIADHGKLVEGWQERLRALPEVQSVTGADNIFRIATRNGPATTMALLDAAAQIGLPVHSLSVQSTTLDDVFVFYTGRQLRDAVQEASPMDSRMMMPRR